MDNKQLIAKKSLEIIGGKPKVIEYHDEKKQSLIDIFIGHNKPYKGIDTYSTIGLSNYNINLEYNEKKLGVEFIGACDSKYEKFGNIVSSCAFNIINSGFSCKLGVVYPNVVKEYYDDYTMEHILFVSPFLWDKLDSIETPSNYILWLMLVPISNNEYEFLKANSLEQLENLFEQNDINIFDLNRKSTV